MIVFSLYLGKDFTLRLLRDPQVSGNPTITELREALPRYDAEDAAKPVDEPTPDPFTPATVGAALRALDAIGDDKGVTTHVLAARLIPQAEGETAPEREQTIARAVRLLKALSRGRLWALTVPGSPQLQWSLPDAKAE